MFYSAVALKFVLDLDEAVYSTFAPVELKSVLECTKEFTFARKAAFKDEKPEPSLVRVVCGGKCIWCAKEFPRSKPAAIRNHQKYCKFNPDRPPTTSAVHCNRAEHFHTSCETCNREFWDPYSLIRHMQESKVHQMLAASNPGVQGTQQAPQSKLHNPEVSNTEPEETEDEGEHDDDKEDTDEDDELENQNPPIAMIGRPCQTEQKEVVAAMRPSKRGRPLDSDDSGCSTLFKRRVGCMQDDSSSADVQQKATNNQVMFDRRVDDEK